jgi:hypothetical protein
VLRAGVMFATVALALASALATQHRPAHAKATAGEAGHSITLRGKFLGSGWRKSLSRTLVRTRLTQFTLCALWDHPASRQFDCIPTAGASLPKGTELRLEQKPPGHGLRRADSPGWGMIGLSPTAVLRAPLSNDVTGNKVGTVRFRVTLRQRSSGAIIYRSNLLLLRWR